MGHDPGCLLDSRRGEKVIELKKVRRMAALTKPELVASSVLEHLGNYRSAMLDYQPRLEADRRDSVSYKLVFLRTPPHVMPGMWGMDDDAWVVVSVIEHGSFPFPLLDASRVGLWTGDLLSRRLGLDEQGGVDLALVFNAITAQLRTEVARRVAERLNPQDGMFRQKSG